MPNNVQRPNVLRLLHAVAVAVAVAASRCSMCLRLRLHRHMHRHTRHRTPTATGLHTHPLISCHRRHRKYLPRRENLVRAKLGMAKFGAEKIWHQCLNITGKFGTKIPRLWLKNKHRPRMVGGISCAPGVGCCYFWRLLDACCYLHARMCMARALKMTPTKMRLQIPQHSLAHFCCAKFCHFKVRLL